MAARAALQFTLPVLTLLLLPALLPGGLAAQAEASCTYPAAVPVPDGRSATAAEMSAAQAEVKAYVASMEQYLDCLAQEEAGLPAEQQTDATRALTLKRHNAAVEAMERLAAQFNEQVRAFKAGARP